jgi:phospholipase C
MLNFHVDTMTTSATCMDAPTMDYPHDIGILNQGRYDAWNTARAAGMGMSYFNRNDLPYYYTLYESFLAGDQYFQSTFTMTNPNRLHLFSGSNGLSVGEIPVLDNTEPVPGWTWETMSETLEAANISWKTYQQADNFDDDGNAWFANFQQAQPGSPLYEKGVKKSVDLIADLENDIINGNLPSVSFIVGPANVSEHATWHPAAGEDMTARILAVFERHPEVYNTTAIILNYDGM